MTVTWVVEKQTSISRLKGNDLIKAACESTGNKFKEIAIIPFVREVEGGDPIIDTPVVVYGSTAIFDVQKRCQWSPGVFTIGDESESLASLGDHYLNSDMKVMSPEEVVPYVETKSWEYFFAKPDNDLKIFDGGVFSAERFPFFMEKTRNYSNYNPNIKVCVSPIKYIEKEWRIFVVDGKIITASQYRKNMKLSIETGITNSALGFAENIVEKNNPARAYVLDICRVDSTYKVVEYNTFNCSGFYACDIEKIVIATNKMIGNNYEN